MRKVSLTFSSYLPLMVRSDRPPIARRPCVLGVALLAGGVRYGRRMWDVVFGDGVERPDVKQTRADARPGRRRSLTAPHRRGAQRSEKLKSDSRWTARRTVRSMI
jgi:hypothetical protein